MPTKVDMMVGNWMVGSWMVSSWMVGSCCLVSVSRSKLEGSDRVYMGSSILRTSHEDNSKRNNEASAKIKWARLGGQKVNDYL